MKAVAFRVDASVTIAMGHFMRCLTLANELRRRGCRVRFLMRHTTEGVTHLLTRSGVEYAPLAPRKRPDTLRGTRHADWLGVEQEHDAADTLEALGNETWDWMVVDHYGIDARWEGAVAATVGRMLVVDDLADRPHRASIVLDQNLFPDLNIRYEPWLPKGTTPLLGPRYALVRPEFLQARNGTSRRCKRSTRLLVSFGGVDAANTTGIALEAIRRLRPRFPSLSGDVVVGAGHPRLREILAQCEALGLAWHVQTDQMASLMASSDLALGGTGSTSWERCCLGLPSVCAPGGYNQIAIGRGLAASGAAVLLEGDASSSAESWHDAVASLLSDRSVMTAMSDAASSLVDGMGVSRVADAMLEA